MLHTSIESVLAEKLGNLHWATIRKFSIHRAGSDVPERKWQGRQQKLAYEGLVKI